MFGLYGLKHHKVEMSQWRDVRTTTTTTTWKDSATQLLISEKLSLAINSIEKILAPCHLHIWTPNILRDLLIKTQRLFSIKYVFRKYFVYCTITIIYTYINICLYKYMHIFAYMQWSTSLF